MKKFGSIAVALLLTLVMSVTAFADNPMDGIESFGYQGNVKMDMSIEDDSISLEIPFVIRQVINRDGTVDMEVEVTVEDEKQMIYFKDGTMYLPLSAQQKLKLETGVSAEMMAVLNDEERINALGEEILENAEVEETEDGYIRVRMAAKTDAMNDMINEMYSAMGLDVTMEELNLYMSMLTDSDDNLKSLRMVMGTTLESEDETASATVSVNLKVISQGQYRQIYFPKDLNLYTRG